MYNPLFNMGEERLPRILLTVIFKQHPDESYKSKLTEANHDDDL